MNEGNWIAIILMGIGVITMGWTLDKHLERIKELEAKVQGIEILEQWAHQHNHENRTIDPILPYVAPVGHR